MPKTLQYKPGSIIYFKGDDADKIFLLRNGTVNLVYQDIETGKEIKEVVQPGEFFGVRAALGHYPQEENTVALQDASALMFSIPEFEAISAKNPSLIMKMLKVFSKQLRRIHKQLADLMKEAEEQQNPEAGLFKVGEYYLKNKRFAQARYVFRRYLTYYPSGKNAVAAANHLERAEFFLAKASKDGEVTGVAQAYQAAVTLISQEQYEQAQRAFKAIVDANEDGEYTAKSAYEIGRCLFLQDKFDDCIQYYTDMIVRYPKHPALGNILFLIGQSHEHANREDQGIAFYKKVMSMVSEAEAVYVQAQSALGRLEV
ncbi:MAG: cyclic nucleotide-binding domain-containing protein [Treponema sp.]|jgi:TolA-binding protein|nr:cyclic nucleotide-binding domain-containing protein [Treponema sp.]